MTGAQFCVAEIQWANKILAADDYVMANGKSAYEVANEVIDAAWDRALENGYVKIIGGTNTLTFE
jgi:citrate lyase beta subunit